MVAPGFGVQRNRRALMAEGGAFATLGELFNAAYDQPTLLHLNPFSDNRSLIGLQTATSEADERVLRSIRTPFEREARNTDLMTGLGYDEERQAEVRQRAVEEGLMVSPEQLNKEFADIELTFDRPMTREAANMLALSKRQQLRRDAVFSASSGSIASYGAMFAGGFAAAAIDPIEFGTAFIPVFGAGRRLMLAQKIGRVPTAMVAGAIDGGIGGAVLEPAYFGLSSAAQLDYTMYDALFNVGVGAAFGATLGGIVDGVRAARGRQDPNAAIVLDDRIAPGTGGRRRRDYYTAEEQDAAIASIAQAVQGHAFDASLYDPRGLKLERRARADLALRTARELAAAYRGDGGRTVAGGLGEALTQLAGPRAATADQVGLARAQKMAADGADRDAIFRETGWFDTGLGWRYQLDPDKVRWRDAGDVDAMLRPGFLRRNFGSMRTLGEILDAPELFKAYPRLAKLPVTFREARETGGGYVQYIRPEIEISAPDAGEALRALRHEVQHAIQHTEGDLGPPTRTGGFYSAVVSYFRRPDEAEARIAERAERGGGSAPALEVSPELQNKAESDLTFDDFQALVRAYIDDRVRQGLLPEAAAQAAKVDVEMMRREWETGRRGFALANGLAQRGDAAQRYTDAEIDQIARETEVLVTSFLEAVFMRYGITVERLQERFPEFLRVERIQELGVEGAAEAIVEQAGDPPPRAPSGDLKGIFQRDTGRIGLTEAADASTAVHEVFHGFIDALIRMAERDDAPDLLKRDLADGVLEAARQVGADGITWRDLGSVGTVAQMIGPRAQGADRSTYGRAEKMIAEGVDRETVRRKTGWYELGGELWAETSDADARLSAAGLDAIDRAAQAFISQRRGDTADPPPATMPLSDFYDHPTLFEQYPRLRRVKLELEIPSEDGAPTQRAGSYYDQQRRTIFVNALERSEYDSVIGVRDPEQIRFELIHEIQHAIQHIEGRTPGGSPKITGIARIRELTPSDTLRADPNFIRAKAAFNAFKGMPKTDFEDHALPRAELEARIAEAYRSRGVPSDEIDQDAQSLGISTGQWLDRFFALPGVPEAIERLRRVREETAATELDSDTVDAETGQRREFGRALPFRSDPEGVAANRRQRTAYQRGLGEVVARLAMVRKSLSESDLAARSPDEDLDLRREDILTDQRFSDVVGDDDVSAAELEARSVAERMVAALDLVRATLEVYPTPDHVKVLAEHPSQPGKYWDPHESPDVIAIQDAYGAVHQLMQPSGYYEGVGALPRAMTQFAREVSDPRRHNQFPQAQRYADALVRLDDLRIGALRAREAVERDRGKEIGEIPHDVPDYRERSIPIQVRSARRKARALYKVLAEIYAARREIMLAKQDIDATPRGSLYEPDADDRLASVFSPGATSGRDVLNPFGSGPETEPAPDAVMRDLMDAADAEPEAEAAPVAKKRRRLFGLFQRVGPRAAGADGEALARAKQMWESGATTGEIRRATGWHRDIAGQWGFEISDDPARDVLELMARGGERYLMEGEAPSEALGRVFAVFSDFLKRIYENADELDVELSPGLRAFYDKMIDPPRGETPIRANRFAAQDRDVDSDLVGRLAREAAERLDDEASIDAQIEALAARSEDAVDAEDLLEMEAIEDSLTRASVWAEGLNAAGACYGRV